MSPSERTPSVVTTTRTANNAGGSKAAKPDIFTGERHKMEDWIVQILTYLEVERIDVEKTKTLTAASYLRGDAQNWSRPLVSAFLERREDP